MTPSLNEIEMTVWKAARGAGLAWGLAEELAQAARWLADRGFDWARPMVACLDSAEHAAGGTPAPVFRDGEWRPAMASQDLSPALCGPLLSDLAATVAPSGPLRFARVAQPMLMLPFAAKAAGDLGSDFTLRLDRACFRLSGTAVEATDTTDIARTEILALSAGDGAPAQGMRAVPPGAARRDIPPDDAARLEAWVHRTYVPASEASRRAGAGAGLTDND